MTIDLKNPPPVPDSEKPAMGLAIELAQFVKDEMGKLERAVRDQVSTALQANAQTVQRIDQLEGSFHQLKSDLEARAVERVDKDLREAEALYLIAREQSDRLSTQEKIEVVQLVEDRQLAAKKARTDYWRGFWDKILPSITTALILAVLVPVWLAIVIGILAFILRALGIQVPLPGG